MLDVSVSINLFDSEELLEALLINYLDIGVKHVSIVYQLVSNHGNEANPKLLNMLNKYKEIGLVDDLIEYRPNKQLSPHFNEMSKRQMGLFSALKNDCKYFITSDCDEFYDKQQFIKAYNYIVENGIESSFCHINDYYVKPQYKIDALQSYYVPFIYKIDVNDCFIMNRFNNPYCDPTRQLKNSGSIIFDANSIVMNHMTTVRATRENLYKKFNNSSAKVNFGDVNSITNRHWDFVLGDANPIHPNIIVVDDKFRINHSLENYIKYWS